LTIFSSFFVFAPIQWLLQKAGPRYGQVLPRLFYTIVLWLVKVRVKVSGRKPGEIAALVVTNHVSWTDIPALGALFPAAFVAKSEVGRWPIIRTFARLVNTIFVDRTARRTIPATNAAMLAAIANGAHVVLFPEATTHADGPHLFHSAHFAIVEDLQKAGQNYAIQPIAIRYSAPYAPWIGDDALLPHIITLTKNPPLMCELIFCEPLILATPLTRRAIAQECFDRIEAAFRS
jgi:1-acyl-sn-glycerol-3-phosphate acyltransferase